MTKGTSTFGKRHNKTHTFCIHCRLKAYHIQKICAQCRFPAAWTSKFKWSVKVNRTTGTGRMRNGFQEGKKAKSVKTNAPAAQPVAVADHRSV